MNIDRRKAICLIPGFYVILKDIALAKNEDSEIKINNLVNRTNLNDPNMESQLESILTDIHAMLYNGKKDNISEIKNYFHILSGYIGDSSTNKFIKDYAIKNGKLYATRSPQQKVPEKTIQKGAKKISEYWALQMALLLLATEKTKLYSELDGIFRYYHSGFIKPFHRILHNDDRITLDESFKDPELDNILLDISSVLNNSENPKLAVNKLKDYFDNLSLIKKNPEKAAEYIYTHFLKDIYLAMKNTKLHDLITEDTKIAKEKIKRNLT